MVVRVAWWLSFAALIGPVPAVAQERFDIAITVDDLPGHGTLPAGTTREAIARSYAETLRKHGVREAFGFVNASKAVADPTIEVVLKIWRDAGFPLGNHAYTHMNLGRAATLEAWQADVVQGEPMVARYMAGKDWHFFRYPNLSQGDGERGVQAAAFLKARGYRIAHVSAAFSDWSYTEAYNRCVAKGDQASIARMKADYLKVVDDGIVRLKAVSQRLYGRQIAQVLLTHLGGWQALMLPAVMDRLDKAGARYVSLARAQAEPAYAEAEKVPGGGSIVDRVAKARGVDLAGIVNPRVSAEVEGMCR